ncbi:MAG: hypothetical protein HY290_00080 [Planctomycetia bacterium]|nr:hypothetical protein [Planctomycetia bacterium]
MAKRKATRKGKRTAKDRQARLEAAARDRRAAELKEREARRQRLLARWPRVDGPFSWIVWHAAINDFCNAVRAEELHGDLAANIGKLLKSERQEFTPAAEEMLGLLQAGFAGRKAAIESRLGELAQAGRKTWVECFLSNSSGWLNLILNPTNDERPAPALPRADGRHPIEKARPSQNRRKPVVKPPRRRAQPKRQAATKSGNRIVRAKNRRT